MRSGIGVVVRDVIGVFCELEVSYASDLLISPLERTEDDNSKEESV